MLSDPLFYPFFSSRDVESQIKRKNYQKFETLIREPLRHFLRIKRRQVNSGEDYFPAYIWEEVLDRYRLIGCLNGFCLPLS